MQNHNEKDIALRRAVNDMAKESRIKLPTNFAFTTMRRIEAERKRAERRNRIAAIASLTMICALGTGTFIWLCADSIVKALRDMAAIYMSADSETLSSVIFMVICLTFFTVLNSILRKRFGNRLDT